MSDQHEGQWDNDVIYGKLLPHVKNMGYTDWVRLGDACAVMQQMRDSLQAQIAALSAPAPALPDEIAETIRCALDETAEDIGMNPAFYADPYEAMRKVEAALSWLAQQRAVPSSGTA